MLSETNQSGRLKLTEIARILEQVYGLPSEHGERGKYHVSVDLLSEVAGFEVKRPTLRNIRAGMGNTLLSMSAIMLGRIAFVAVISALTVTNDWPRPGHDVLNAALKGRSKRFVDRVRRLYDTEIQRSFVLDRAELRMLADKPKLTKDDELTFAGELLDAGFALFEPSVGSRGSRLFGLCRAREIESSWRRAERVTLEEAKQWLRAFDPETDDLAPASGE